MKLTRPNYLETRASANSSQPAILLGASSKTPVHPIWIDDASFSAREARPDPSKKGDAVIGNIPNSSVPRTTQWLGPEPAAVPPPWSHPQQRSMRRHEPSRSSKSATHSQFLLTPAALHVGAQGIHDSPYLLLAASSFLETLLFKGCGLKPVMHKSHQKIVLRAGKAVLPFGNRNRIADTSIY